MAFPKYPCRRVYVLDGLWDFAFLGDISVSTAVAVREEDLRRQARVPDAFDARDWLCFNASQNSTQPQCPIDDGRPCSVCCDLRRGPRGDESCWADASGYEFRHCCDPVALRRRGVAAYRTFLPRAVSRLHFRACAMYCAVYVDRHMVGEHIGGYSPFWVDVGDYATGRGETDCAQEKADSVELLVVADNRFSSEWPVHQPYFDWYQPGGLLRSVEAHALREPRFYIKHAEVLPRKHEFGIVVVRLRVSEDCVGRGFRVTLAFDGGSADVGRVVAADEEEGVWSEAVPNPRRWSNSSPELHVLQIILWDNRRTLDCIDVRFGLRSLDVGDGYITLNGVPLFLQGVNRHETHPFGGVALTEAQLRADADVLQELGVNFVRGAHYSQDQRWLDLCDERGILVWEETLGWQPRLEHLMDSTFIWQQLQALDETINASVNHPSVIMWGFLNEGEADSNDARPAYAALADFAKRRDSTRFVTWASKSKMQDRTLEFADIISFNDYPGWYDASLGEIPAVWQSYADWSRRHHPGKPFLVGEVGASGLPGFKSITMAKWSEDLQAAIIRASIISARVIGSAGIALWQFTDNPIDPGLFYQDNPPTSPWPNVTDADWVEHVAVTYEALVSPFGVHLPLRPRGLNNKGLLSVDRRHRKLAFWAAQAGYRGACAAAGLTSDPGGLWLGRSVSLVHAGLTRAAGSEMLCIGCYVSVHTWNAADQVSTEPVVIRVHVHADRVRASTLELQQGGIVRLVGHTDGRSSGLGSYLSVGNAKDGSSHYVVVHEALNSLWALEPSAAAGGVLLRVVFGEACGSYLALDAFSQSGLRDEKSTYLQVHPERQVASTWNLRPPGA